MHVTLRIMLSQKNRLISRLSILIVHSNVIAHANLYKKNISLKQLSRKYQFTLNIGELLKKQLLPEEIFR